MYSVAWPFLLFINRIKTDLMLVRLDFYAILTLILNF